MAFPVVGARQAYLRVLGCLLVVCVVFLIQRLRFKHRLFAFQTCLACPKYGADGCTDTK